MSKNAGLTEEVKMFLSVIDEGTDSCFLERHVDIYLIVALEMIDTAARNRLITGEERDIVKQSVKNEVNEFKRKIKNER